VRRVDSDHANRTSNERGDPRRSAAPRPRGSVAARNRRLGWSQPAVSKVIRAAQGKYEQDAGGRRSCDRIAAGDSPSAIAAAIGRQPERSLGRRLTCVTRTDRYDAHLRSRIVSPRYRGRDFTRRASRRVDRAFGDQRERSRVRDRRSCYTYCHISPLSPYAAMAMSRHHTARASWSIALSWRATWAACCLPVRRCITSTETGRTTGSRTCNCARGHTVAGLCWPVDCGSHNIKPVPLP
jgi:hypothetical protein